VLSLLLALSCAGAAGAQPPLVQWRLDGARLLADPGAPQTPLRVGSLQKPFVARAWAAAHPEAAIPRHDCRGGQACWLAAGHGRLGLAGATAVSCNAYFRALAAETPAETLARVLRDEGFRVEGAVTPDAAIGLGGPGGADIAIEPEALLRAYVRLVREPWPRGERARGELLAGLRAAGLDGTARGLGGSGVFAKTGTAPSIEGRPLTTSGLAVVVDGAGSARLGLLPRGTGREAAAALASASALAPARPPAASGRVRVALLSLLGPRRVLARNVGSVPQRTGAGWVGPGGERDLRPGERLEEGLWELRLGERSLVRRLEGAIEVEGRDDGTLGLVAELEPFEYVAGVAAAELLSEDPARLVSLGAAVLRFLAVGPRHARADVCDSTHCAYFVGRGPRAAWPGGRQAILVDARAALAVPGGRIAPDRRDAIRSEARRPGPSHWTSHCGGESLSAHFVWGTGDATVAACPRHGPARSRPWSRAWPRRDVEDAFGPGVRRLAVVSEGGTWRLRVENAAGTRAWLFDEAHRALAPALGWAALPSPADRVSEADGAFLAEGRGLGHRVGLCLAD